jgi:hypothetical protein
MGKKYRSSDAASSVMDQTEAMTDAHTVGEKEEELLQEVMADNLDIMLAIILKIREDPEYASNIYANCPRLQYLLIQHPALRPVFEDSKLIQINFEQVYKKAGGILPEDKPNYYRNILKCIVMHPLFKVLRFLLFIKKIVSCALGSGIGLVTSMFVADASADANNADNALNNEVHDGNPINQDNRESLNRAADYMEGKDLIFFALMRLDLSRDTKLYFSLYHRSAYRT